MTSPPGADDHPADAQAARDAALQDLREIRQFARHKTTGDGRIRDHDRAEIRIKYMRLIVQAANAECRLLRDKDLDELAERLDELETAAANTDTPVEAWVSDA